MYEDQPPFFIEEILIFSLQEGEREKQQIEHPKPLNSSGFQR